MMYSVRELDNDPENTSETVPEIAQKPAPGYNQIKKYNAEEYKLMIYVYITDSFKSITQ